MRASINGFAALAGLVKKVKRTGWLRYLPEGKVESVGDHSAKIAFLALCLRGMESVDHVRCLQMALVHDIAEGLVGDFTPYCNISPEEKFAKEERAVREIFGQLGEDNARYYEALWLEYERAETYEARLVKDLDKLEMVQQAWQYEKEHGVELTEFYECVGKMRTEVVRGWAEELLRERDDYLRTQSKPQ